MTDMQDDPYEGFDEAFEQELGRLLQNESELNTIIRTYLADTGWREEQPFPGASPLWTRDPAGGERSRYIQYPQAIIEQILREQGQVS